LKELDQNQAPIYEAMVKLRKKRIVPFDVPGHKRGRGNPELVELLGEKCVGIDVNSMKPLDNLGHPISIIRDAEELAADAFGASHAFLMIGGTTSSVQTMILSTCKAGDKIILPRNVHKSAINALVLCGAIPIYIEMSVDPKIGIALGLENDRVAQAIKDKKLGWKWLENRASVHAPDIVADGLSSGIGAVWDYTRKAENFNAGEAAKAFTSASIFGLAKGGVAKGVKVGYSDKISSKTNDSITKIKESYKGKVAPGEKAPIKVKLQEKWDIANEFTRGATKQTVINEFASRGANATFGWLDKNFQRDALQKSARNQTPVSERRAQMLKGKDFTDAVMGTPKDLLKSGAGSIKSHRSEMKDSANAGTDTTTVSATETSEGK